ncbi:MAG: CocE/NonD family hydrolase [Deltaproteobacteria bacterium]|nr:CocE/NonD family hydrolase [Deltaproteobacteria bacterium]
MAVLLGGAAAGCGDNEESGPFDVRPSVEQLAVTHAPAMTELEVVDASGARVAVATTDAHGSLMFRGLAPGPGYEVRTTTLEPIESVGPLEVMSIESSQPDPSLYTKQKLVAGNQYITTRDGTTLSAFVTLPGPIEEGPYPTVVTYSGYDESRPGAPAVDESLMGLCESLPILCAAPTNPSALIAGLFGYATVSVNLRGTGCSGGAFDYFETMELLDGYDAIETVAAQSWVANGKVGMVGLSYPGISQLFVASVKPPHLAAIAPMSVIGDSATTMLPGGILNDGFATEWITQVISKAKPYGQGWEQGQVDAGDTVCAENQLLHDQYVDNVAVARAITFYEPAKHDRYNPSSFVDQIEVPVFLASAWQDEQTGPYFFTLLDKFTSSPAVRLTVYNGVHIDAFQPAVLEQWFDFLDLFVAQRVPTDHALERTLAPQLFETVFGTSALKLAPSKYIGVASVDAAVAMWKSTPPIRVLFESGAGGAPGEPTPAFEHAFSQWPPVETTAVRLYAQPDGSLASTMPAAIAPAATFTLDAAAGGRGILIDGSVWDLLPHYDWRQPAADSAVVWVTTPLAADQVMMGTASADLWLRSPVVDDADLEVTISEVRPDGQEMYVQSGWVRASVSASGSAATPLWPAPSFLEVGNARLVPGAWTQVRVGTAGFQHVFRAGSRVRISIDTPGDTRAQWRFALEAFPNVATYELGVDSAHPSSVALPVLAGVSAPSPLPPCPSLRGQQCRAYVPYANTPAN